MTPVNHVVYLHGFASSPASSKARRFAEELRALDVGFSCPDLNLPAFETLTVSRMLADVTRAIGTVAPDGPVALVGSSLGGFVALHAAALPAGHRVDRVILLAPALDFGGNRLRQLGEHEIAQWRRDGHLRVMHHASNAYRDVGYALYEDAQQYDAFAIGYDRPILAYQGERDEVVNPAMVKDWAADRPNVRLHLLDDDHQLASSMDEIWAGSRRFLGLP